MKATIKQVAELAGVSPSAASTALSGRKNNIGISSATHARVWQAAKALNYSGRVVEGRRRGESARFRQNGTRSVGIICDRRNEYDVSTQVVIGALEKSLSGGKAVTQVIELEGGAARARSLLDAVDVLRADDTDGFVVVDVHGDIASQTLSNAIPILNEQGTPYVVVTSREQPRVCPCILHDQRATGIQAALHLIERGFRTLAFFAPFGRAWEGDRFAGVREAVALSELPGERLTLWTPNGPSLNALPESEAHAARIEYATAFLAETLGDSTAARETAVVACNDVAAFLVIEAGEAMGLSPGKDYALIGFDDLPQARFAGLTSLQPPLQGMGLEAGHLLMRLIGGESAEAELRLRSQVIARNSTVPLADRA